MKKVKQYIEEIRDEVHGARAYAERYIILKSRAAVAGNGTAAQDNQFANLYKDMAAQELQHAENLRAICQAFVSGLTYLDEACRDEWEDCIAHYAEKAATVRLMLSK